jgi:selenide,water dikinase
MGPAALAQVLRPLTLTTHPDLVVGLQTSDDAAVYRIAPDVAIVQTVDFFTPIVDDSWTYGAIAAANSMSDIYAMGGTVLFALNVGGFPEDLPAAMVTAIFQGAADKIAEAGAIIAGGHTVIDPEPKFGLVVTGTIHPDRIWTKAGALPGDVLFLTKPIGTGLVATALKRGRARGEDVDAATASMLTLNHAAAESARHAGGVRAATDITGFGLLGHASEMAEKSGAGLRIDARSVPLLPGAKEYARAGHVAAGLLRNRAYFESHAGGIRFDPSVDETLRTILFDPQTSGGLLVAVEPGRADDLARAFSDARLPCWRIGEVVAAKGIDVAP